MSERPKLTPLATGCISKDTWELALDRTEGMANWLDFFLGWLPGVSYHLWNTRATAFAMGYQIAMGVEQ